jgi:hypothetical protein
MRKILMVMATVALVGCSKKSPADKCNDLIGRFCHRVIVCLAADAPPDAMNQCRMALAQAVDCSKATTVNGNYDQCVKDIDVQACDALFSSGVAPPASCNNVFGP